MTFLGLHPIAFLLLMICSALYLSEYGTLLLTLHEAIVLLRVLLNRL